ncbi:zinc-dependent metalloprotease [Massilia sp. W12]|uniref:zinc-dependent metalloprotease n=1 Tax=Massilia sp. W12 TaxID=3126507 RepID=UPI0030D3C56D
MKNSQFALSALAASFCLAFAAHAQESPAPAAGAAAPAAAARPPAPGEAKPFKDVIKDAKEQKGFFNVYQKDEKVWIEIRPEQFDKPFFFSANVPHSIGERRLYSSQMGPSHVVSFKKIGNTVQLLAKNTEFSAKPGTPQAVTVSQAFSDSLIGSAAVASAPHPESKGILIDASQLLFGDLVGYSTILEYAFRLPFAPDARNSSFSRVRSAEDLTGFLVNTHFATPRIPAPPLTPPPVALPPPPHTTPDPRSMFVGFYYSFRPLPASPMAARIADDRVGHFVMTQYDYTEDLSPKAARHMVKRWRLEKKDPQAALSEPVTPITYWLDKNIPHKYRKSVTEGVLEWNKAFERIGFKNAIVVKQQADDADFDTMDASHASIRWFVGADVGFAIGPSHADPRTGEILDADIGMSDVFTRGSRRFIAEDSMPLNGHGKHQEHCQYAHGAANEMGFAMGLLEARGELEMDSPKAEALAQAYMKDVIMHEVGHTLGLRHNFRSSTIYSLKQLSDPNFTKQNGMSGSVMDYNPFNIATKGEPQGEYVMSTLGPYDYWAIEYAYRPLPADKEKEELAKIAARSTEPQLAYGTDEDAYTWAADPDVNVFDLGTDALGYFKRRLTNSRELWDRLQSKQLKSGESYETLRRSYEFGFNQFARAIPSLLKYVGGVTFLRDRAGGRATFTPVDGKQQREALALLTNNLFKADSFRITPELAARLAPDHFEDRGQRGDISLSRSILKLQAGALDQLMGDSVALRLLDSPEKVADAKNLLSLAQLHETLQNAIWSELKGGKDIPALRRNLQREHLKRLANALLKPAPGTPADARSLQRMTAQSLLKDISAAAAQMSSKEARAHLAECQATLAEALKAPLMRAGV